MVPHQIAALVSISGPKSIGMGIAMSQPTEDRGRGTGGATGAPPRHEGVGRVRALNEAIENLDGFCSASVMAQPASRRAVIPATYDSGEVLDRNRDAARSLRTTRLRDLGAEQIDICEFELAIARLRVPEMA